MEVRAEMEMSSSGISSKAIVRERWVIEDILNFSCIV